MSGLFEKRLTSLHCLDDDTYTVTPEKLQHLLNDARKEFPSFNFAQPRAKEGEWEGVAVGKDFVPKVAQWFEKWFGNDGK